MDKLQVVSANTCSSAYSIHILNLQSLKSKSGNVADWSDAKWEVTNMSPSSELSETSMCQENYLGPTLFPELLPMEKSNELCKQIGGNMFVIGTEAAKQTALKLLNQTEKCSLRVWTGWWDVEGSNVYSSIFKPEESLESYEMHSNWAPGEPNGDIAENCVAMENSKFRDKSCSTAFCGICYVENHPTFLLRGEFNFLHNAWLESISFFFRSIF